MAFFNPAFQQNITKVLIQLLHNFVGDFHIQPDDQAVTHIAGRVEDAVKSGDRFTGFVYLVGDGK